jgi:hypothetical protein
MSISQEHSRNIADLANLVPDINPAVVARVYWSSWGGTMTATRSEIRLVYDQLHPCFFRRRLGRMLAGG